jgi:hypothetical protein
MGEGVMATKTIDVTLETIRNASTFSVAPKGAINARTVRAVDDEQIFQSENLYLHLDSGGPIHPGGATHIPPGQTLAFNVTKRLKVSHFGVESVGHLNQMLIFQRDLTERLVAAGQGHDASYQGNFNHKVRFDEINEFQTISVDYRAIHFDVTAKIIVTYAVNLI